MPGELKTVSRFCGQSDACNPEAVSKVHGPPFHPSAAISNPTPWWKVRPVGPVISGNGKAGPVNLSEKTSSRNCDTGQSAPADVVPVPTWHVNVYNLQAGCPFSNSPLWIRQLEVAKEVPAAYLLCHSVGSSGISAVFGIVLFAS